MGVLGLNHVAFRSPDPAALREFYLELTGGEALDAAHDPVRLGSVLLVFFESETGGPGDRDPDELAFDVDARGFGEILANAERMGCVTKQPVEPTPWSRAFLVADPEGRRIEFTYDDRAVYWQE